MWSTLILAKFVAHLALFYRDDTPILVIFQVLLGKTTLRFFRVSIHDLAPRTYLASLVRHLYSCHKLIWECGFLILAVMYQN
jgi:hypothetical protein